MSGSGGGRASRTPSAALEAPLTAAHAALACGAWEEARDRFQDALRAAPSAEAWEGYATAASRLDDAPAALAARERAFREYRVRDDAAGAARCALWLASDIMEFEGDFAVLNGWLRRAGHLLADVDPPAPEQALLRIFHAHLALMRDNDTAAARRHCEDAIACARRTRAVDLEMMAGAIHGLALVSEGRVADGMGWLDEAAAAAVAGELTDLNTIASSCCYLIHACERVRDFTRAAQWGERVRALADRWHLGSFFVICRTQYASILMCRGEFAACEAELASALRHAEGHRPALGRAATVRLGELRRRQGRFDEAEALFARAPTHRVAVLGRALLALDRGEPADAADLLEGLLGRAPTANRTERALPLEALARASAAAVGLPDAERAADELEAIAAVIGTDSLRAAACATRGVVLAAAGRYTEARRALEAAVVHYEASEEWYEMARARTELARVLVALGRRTAAEEATGAAAALDAMGAAFEAARARAVAGEDAPAARAGGRARPVLTAREIDVLRLIASGMSDRAIAARLAVSEHTVHRHVSNILRKLDVRSRAAAAARGVRMGLL